MQQTQRKQAAPVVRGPPRTGRLYVFGGRSADGCSRPDGEPPRPGGETLGNAECFTPEEGDPRLNHATGQVVGGRFAAWEYLKPMPRCHHGSCAAVIGERIYVVGGTDGLHATNTVDVYNPELKMWEAVPPMNAKRAQAAAAELGGQLLVLGGFTAVGAHGLGILDSVEAFDPTTCEWQKLPPMLQARQDFCAVTSMEKLYIFGGSNDLGESLSTAEVFAPPLFGSETEGPVTWEPVAEMNEPRRGAAAIVVNARPWVIGGHTGAKCLNSLEAFDPSANLWRVLSTMEEPRYAMAVGFFNGKLWVCGGHNGQRHLDSGECFEPIEGEWTQMPLKLNEARSGVSYATILDPLLPGQEPMSPKRGKGGGKGDDLQRSSTQQFSPKASSPTSQASPKQRGSIASSASIESTPKAAKQSGPSQAAKDMAALFAAKPMDRVNDETARRDSFNQQANQPG